MTRDGNGRKSVGGRSIRWNDERAAEAYAAGHWVHGTLADALRGAARDTPARVVVVDGDVRLDCRGLHARARALAKALGERMQVGSVVSFMLPNWHEAAVVYLGTTLAGMVESHSALTARPRSCASSSTTSRAG
jgi:non-ribosomal peptide synthetase component E (peptide arylation enzyme)